jgi:DNA-binding response OmpR family regulator
MSRTDPVPLPAGADDYLVKPFSVTVLFARLRAHLRRRPISTATETALQLGALSIDLASRRCHIEGSALGLPTITTLRGYGYRLDAPRSEKGSAQT